MFQVVPKTPQVNLYDMPGHVNGGQGIPIHGGTFQGTADRVWSVALKGEEKTDLKTCKEWCTFQPKHDAPFIVPKLIPASMDIVSFES